MNLDANNRYSSSGRLLHNFGANLKMPDEVRTHADSIPVFVESPYSIALDRTLGMPIYDKRVIVSWYQRYFNTLPSDDADATKVQPLEEVEDRELDLALSKYMGYDHPCLTNPQLFDSEQCHSTRWQMFQRHVRDMEQMDREKKRKKQEMEREATKVAGFDNVRGNKLGNKSSSVNWLSRKEGQAVDTVVGTFVTTTQKKRFHRVSKKKQNKAPGLTQGSLWAILRRPETRLKLVIRDRMERANSKLQKFLRSFVIISVFCQSLLEKVRTPYAIYEGLNILTGATKGRLQSRFNPTNFVKRREIDPDVLKTLTSPWRERNHVDVNNAIEALQDVHAFAIMPPLFQQYVAWVSWYICIPDKTTVVRQGQLAEYFYIVISGNVAVTRLIGSPVVGEYGDKEYVKTYHRYEMFGEECLEGCAVKRRYDAHAVTRTCLLAIPKYDYFEITVDITWNVAMPEHLKVVKQILDNYDFPEPKTTIFIPGNVVYHYFPSGATIASSVKNSDWVFIVSTGTIVSISIVDAFLAHRLYDPMDTRRSTQTFVPVGYFEDAVRTSKMEINTDKYIDPNIDLTPKVVPEAIELKNLIDKTANIFETLPVSTQDRIITEQKSEKMRDYFSCMFMPGRVITYSVDPSTLSIPSPTASKVGKTKKRYKRSKQSGTINTRSLADLNDVTDNISDNAAIGHMCRLNRNNCHGEIATKAQNTDVNLKKINCATSVSVLPSLTPVHRKEFQVGIQSNRKEIRDNLKHNASIKAKNVDNRHNVHRPEMNHPQVRRKPVVSSDGRHNNSDLCRKMCSKSFEANSSNNQMKKQSVVNERKGVAFSKCSLRNQCNDLDKPQLRPISSAKHNTSREPGKLSRVKSAPIATHRIKEQDNPLNGRLAHQYDKKCVNRNNSAVQDNLKSPKTREKKSKKKVAQDQDDPRIKKSQQPSELVPNSNIKREFATPSESASDISGVQKQHSLRFSPMLPEKEKAASSRNESVISTPSRIRSDYARSGAQIKTSNVDSKTSLIESNTSISFVPSYSGSESMWSNDDSESSLEIGVDNQKRQVKSTTFVDVDPAKKTDSTQECEKVPENKPSGIFHRPSNMRTSIKADVKGIHRRLATVGFEWLDMWDGKYRPPQCDVSLMSQGAAVIMISKKALLECFRYGP